MQNEIGDTANNIKREISIVYEDEDLLALNKPSGISVHPDGKSEELTLVDWVIERYPEMEKVGEPLKVSSGAVVNRAGIVHRLDKETSGIVLFAKHQDAFFYMKELFKNREVKKTYKAFVYGEMSLPAGGDTGVIDRPIGRSKKDFRLKSATRGASGKLRDAVTEYKVERSAHGFSYLSVFPKTGRTHQIRVHLKAVNYPIVCDKLYAPKKPCELGFKRLALHAFSLSFKTSRGENLTLEVPLPRDFKGALAELEK
ncbi:MAG: RluA family pseudouridine synthase [Candidatus Paceibacterota bacterium]